MNLGAGQEIKMQTYKVFEEGRSDRQTTPDGHQLKKRKISSSVKKGQELQRGILI